MLGCLTSGCSSVTATAGGTSIDGAVMSTAEPMVSDCAGVTVIIDFSLLNAPRVDECVALAEPEPALDVLARAGASVTGTDSYGTAIVCRVNNRPSSSEQIVVPGHDAFVEPCTTMPPEFAYWALWVKQGSPSWEYAMVGVADLTLSPGDSVGLVFTTGTSTPTPN